MLNNESWDNAFHQNNINKSFNSFLNTFLIFSEPYFLIIHATVKTKNNHWITTGIRISCKRKKNLYIQVDMTDY